MKELSKEKVGAVNEREMVSLFVRDSAAKPHEGHASIPLIDTCTWGHDEPFAQPPLEAPGNRKPCSMKYGQIGLPLNVYDCSSARCAGVSLATGEPCKARTACETDAPLARSSETTRSLRPVPAEPVACARPREPASDAGTADLERLLAFGPAM